MNEATMTDADMKQREKIVKSMKKNFKDFRNRYGADAKNVMYATATKMAMKEAVKDEADKGEYDYEGDMAKSSLRTIVRNAQMMHDMLGEDTNLPEWVASKITLAEDYLVSAAQYMQSEMSEEVELEEGEVKTANKASKNAYMKKQGAGDVARGRLKNRATQKSDPYKHRTSMDRLATMAHAERKARLDSYGRNQNDRTKKVAWNNLPDHLKKIGSNFRPSDVAKAKAAGKLPLKKANEEVEQMDEYNATPFRNAERGPRGSKPAGQPRTSNSRQFFRPPEGFTKKGIEKGGGIKTVYHYKGKSTTPSGATMKMGGVTVPMGKTPTKRRVKEEQEQQVETPNRSNN